MKSLWKYFHYTLNVRSRGIKSWCFPRLRLGKHQNSRENKTNWFPEGHDIKCFVIFPDFHFNSNKRITGENQIVDSALSIRTLTQIYFSKPLNEWFAKYFPYIICIFFLHYLLFLFRNNFENGFSWRLPGCVVVFIHEKENWRSFSRLLSLHFPPCFDHVL